MRFFSEFFGEKILRDIESALYWPILTRIVTLHIEGKYMENLCISIGIPLKLFPITSKPATD